MRGDLDYSGRFIMNSDIKQKVDFISELEKLKLVLRTNKKFDKTSLENSAEHSWHIAIMALIFKDNYKTHHYDLLKVLTMLLIHDIVEIDVGDFDLYGKDSEKIHILEEKAAYRIFGLLPKKNAEDFINLWKEFEDRITDESKIANAIDNLQPLINHSLTRNTNEKVLNVKYSEILSKKYFIKEVSDELWDVALYFIENGIINGLYIDDR